MEASFAGGTRGRVRLRLVQMHRLVQFEAAFGAYLEGKVSAEYVKLRARKMLAVGLPPFAVARRSRR